MGFVDVRLSDVELERPLPLGNGTYVFQLLPGAEYKPNKYNGIEELNVTAAVAEGENAGKRTFFRYPDPTATSANGKSMAWSAQALKKLEIALGADSLPGEDPATFLNRVALNGHARFTGVIGPQKNIIEGEDEPRSEFKLFAVSAAA